MTAEPEPATGGVAVTVSRTRIVRAPVERTRRQREQADDDDEAEHSDQAIIDDVIGAGPGPGKVVDTDDEPSAGSLCSSSSSSDELIIAKPVKPASEAATGSDDEATDAATCAQATQTRVRRSGITPDWTDDYFVLWDHPGFSFIRMEIRKGWRRPFPVGMGTTRLSKSITPTLVGDQRSDPTRTVLLLRAWALWRARKDGWADHQRGRARHFKELADLLEKDIKSLGYRLLGDQSADKLLNTWVPELVERLTSRRPPPDAATGAPAASRIAFLQRV